MDSTARDSAAEADQLANLAKAWSESLREDKALVAAVLAVRAELRALRESQASPGVIGAALTAVGA